MVLWSSTMVIYFHSFMNWIATHFFTLWTTIRAIQMPTAKLRDSIHSNLQFRHIIVVHHTRPTVEPVSLLVTSILISSMMKSIYGYSFLTRRRIYQCTGASSATSAELLWTSFSGTLQWQLSETLLRPTLHSKGSTRYPMRWASTLGYQAKCVIAIWPIQTTFAMMITHVSFTTIVLNPLSSSYNNLRSGEVCCMVQQINSLKLRNVSNQRWNEATSGGMNRYVSWISW